MTILIKNGRIITDQEDYTADIFIENGKIRTIFTKINNEADIVIAHNLKKFDKKRANAAFLKHGLNLPSHYREIDTLITARQQFALPSNRLDFIAEYLKVPGKMVTPVGLWRRAIEADMEAIDLMDEYCKQDGGSQSQRETGYVGDQGNRVTSDDPKNVC